MAAVACLAVAHLALFASWLPGARPSQRTKSRAEEELQDSEAGLNARDTQLASPIPGEVDELKSRARERADTQARSGTDTPVRRPSALGGARVTWAREEGVASDDEGGDNQRLPRAPTDTPATSPTTAPYLKSGAQLYDALYQIGYHNGTRHHAGFLLRALDKMRRDFRFKRGSSVLDVGCSHGGAVRELWRTGWLANGVDVSQYAILAANKELDRQQAAAAASRKSFVARCAVQPCFQTAPAGQLPFASASFDIALSSDVLEHVEEVAIPRAVAEIARVVRRFALLKISNRGESGAKELNALKNASGASGTTRLLPKQLHATIRGPDFWLDHMEAAGLYVYSVLEQEDLVYAKKLPWECCSYVVRPAREADGAAARDGVLEHAGRSP